MKNLTIYLIIIFFTSNISTILYGQVEPYECIPAKCIEWANGIDLDVVFAPVYINVDCPPKNITISVDIENPFNIGEYALTVNSNSQYFNPALSPALNYPGGDFEIPIGFTVPPYPYFEVGESIDAGVEICIKSRSSDCEICELVNFVLYRGGYIKTNVTKEVNVNEECTTPLTLADVTGNPLPLLTHGLPLILCCDDSREFNWNFSVESSLSFDVGIPNLVDFGFDFGGGYDWGETQVLSGPGAGNGCTSFSVVYQKLKTIVRRRFHSTSECWQLSEFEAGKTKQVSKTRM